MTAVEGWYVHYVGSDLSVAPTLAASEATMRSLQAQAEHGEHGDKYIDFPYSFAVDPSGNIFEGRGWDVQSAATLNNNAHSWSVVYLGGPDTPLTDEGKAALHWLCQEGARRKPLISFVRPHSAVFATACPGDALRAFVPELQARLHDSNAVAPPIVDWHAVSELAAWQKRVTDAPLERDAHRPLDTQILRDLLIKRGYDVEPGTVYGPKVVAAVKKFKIDHKVPDHDGTHFGGPAAAAILK